MTAVYDTAVYIVAGYIAAWYITASYVTAYYCGAYDRRPILQQCNTAGYKTAGLLWQSVLGQGKLRHGILMAQ